MRLFWLILLIATKVDALIDAIPIVSTSALPIAFYTPILVTPTTGTYLISSTGTLSVIDMRGVYPVTPTTGTYYMASTGTLTVTQGPGSFNLNFSSGTSGNPLVVASTSGFVVTSGSGSWLATPNGTYSVTPTTGTYLVSSTGTLSVVDMRGVYPVTPTTGTYYMASTGTLTITQGSGSLNLNFSSGTSGNPFIVASTSGFVVTSGSGSWLATPNGTYSVTPTTGTYLVSSTGTLSTIDMRGVYPVTPTTGTYYVASTGTFSVLDTRGVYPVTPTTGTYYTSSTGTIHVGIENFAGSTLTVRSMYGNNSSAFVAYSTGNLANQSTFFAMLNVSGSTTVARIRSIALSPIIPTTVWAATQTFNLTLITGIQAGQAIASNTAVNSVYIRQMDSNDAPLNAALWIATGAVAPTGIGKMAFNAVTIAGNNTNMPFQPTYLWNADSVWHDPLTLRAGQGFLVYMSTTGAVAPTGFIGVTTIFTQE